MTWWVEIRAGKARSGKVRLVPLNEVNNYRGFRSVFAFDDTTADDIRTTNSTRNLRDRGVYSEQIFMDFDNGDPVDFRNWLVGEQVSATEWHSGGRSYHFHVDTLPVHGVWVPYACRDWARTNAPTADLSFYTHSGMYRLPGTWHAKFPGQRKHLLATYAGKPVELRQPDVAPLVYSASVGDSDDFWTMLHTPKSHGQRTVYIWTLAVVAARAGIDIDTALRNILVWNKRDPHPTEYVTRKVKEAYAYDQF